MARGETSQIDVSAVSELGHLHRALVNAGAAQCTARPRIRARGGEPRSWTALSSSTSAAPSSLSNPAAERIFGYRADEVIGQNVKVLMPDRYHGQHDTGLANYVRTGEARIIGIGREIEGRRRERLDLPMDIAVSEFNAATNGSSRESLRGYYRA